MEGGANAEIETAEQSDGESAEEGEPLSNDDNAGPEGQPCDEGVEAGGAAETDMSFDDMNIWEVDMAVELQQAHKENVGGVQQQMVVLRAIREIQKPYADKEDYEMEREAFDLWASFKKCCAKRAFKIDWKLLDRGYPGWFKKSIAAIKKELVTLAPREQYDGVDVINCFGVSKRPRKKTIKFGQQEVAQVIEVISDDDDEMKTPRKRKPAKLSPSSSKDEKQGLEKTPKQRSSQQKKKKAMSEQQRSSQRKQMKAMSELESLKEEYAQSKDPKVVISSATATRKHWSAETTGSYHIALPTVQKEDDPKDKAFYHENGAGNLIFKACASHPFRYTTGVAVPYEVALNRRAKACKACKWSQLENVSSQVHIDRPEGTPLKSKDKPEEKPQDEDTVSEGDEWTESDEETRRRPRRAQK